MSTHNVNEAFNEYGNRSDPQFSVQSPRSARRQCADCGGWRSGSAGGSADAGAPSFNSALAAAKSGQSNQAASGNGAQAGNKAPAPAQAAADSTEGTAPDASSSAAVATNAASASLGKDAPKATAARATSSAGAAKSKSAPLPAFAPQPVSRRPIQPICRPRALRVIRRCPETMTAAAMP